jgi:CheY-like chemotaxis protein
MNPERHVLVVDDEPSIRSVYSIAFQHRGYRVSLSGTAEDAMEVLEKEEVDVLCADLNLPGMNGLELVRKLTGRFPNLSRIAVTGNPHQFQPDACREAGYHQVLAKPVTLDALLQAAESSPPSRHD